jgi:hypothetical protein
MLEYGSHSPIGGRRLHVVIFVANAPTARQEKLLQGMLTEILHLTSTQNPLSVRMPLYPFSHDRVFKNATLDTQSEESSGSGGSRIAPLPSPSPLDEDMPLVPGERY